MIITRKSIHLIQMQDKTKNNIYDYYQAGWTKEKKTGAGGRLQLNNHAPCVCGFE